MWNSCQNHFSRSTDPSWKRTLHGASQTERLREKGKGDGSWIVSAQTRALTKPILFMRNAGWQLRIRKGARQPVEKRS